jgi:death-on-curing protein
MADQAPLFLNLDEVLALQAEQIERYGGTPGVRDMHLLESAIGTPQATFDGELLHASIVEQAAAYLFHLCQNHPFVDGNKRIALMATIAFLGLNDYRLDADEDELVEFVLRIAAGDLSKFEVGVFLKQRVVALG